MENLLYIIGKADRGKKGKPILGDKLHKLGELSTFVKWYIDTD